MLHDEAPQAPAPAPAATPAAGAAAPAAEPTLHDFVLKLLQDPSAQQAFDLDPTGCLKAAGLHDLTPADVHDVIPLVTDLVPGNGFGDLTSGLALDGEAGLEGGWATVGSESPLGELAGAGQFDVDRHGVDAAVVGHQDTAAGTFGGAVRFDGGLDGVHGGTGVYTPFGDVETTLAAEVSEHGVHVNAGLSSSHGAASIDLDHNLDIQQNLVPGLPDVAGLTQGLPGLPDLGNVTGMLPDLPGLAGGGLPDVGNVTGVVSDLAGGGLPDVGGVTGLVPSLPGLPGVGDVSGLVPGLPDVGSVSGLVPNLPQLPALPEVGDLGKGLADPTAAASALAGAVPVLPALPAVPGLAGLPQLPGLPELSNLPVQLPQLPALPEAPVAQVNHAVDNGQDAVNQSIDATQAGHLPDIAGHLPQLPVHVPAINLPDLPVHLPELPVHLPQLPSLPIGDASGHSPVGDIVDHTGLGGVINNNPVTDAVHDVVPDLHLGL